MGSAPFSRPEAGSRTVAWGAVVPAFFATTAGILPGFLNAGLAVQIRYDLGLTLTELGALIGLFFATAGVLSPATGRWSEAHGWAASLRTATALTAVSLAGIAWLGSDLPTLAPFLMIGGVGSALGQVASNLAIARCVTSTRHGFIFGLRHASVPAAAALAGAAVPTVALTIGWRWAFAGGALLALVAGAAVPFREGPHIRNPPPPAAAPPDAGTGTTKLLVMLSAAVGVGIAGIDGFTTFFVSYAVSTGVAETTAGLLLTAGSIAGITTRLIAGWRIDRVRHTDLTTVAAMMGLGAAGVAVLNLGGHPALVLGGFLAFAAGWGWSGLFTFAVVRANPAAPAAASGITQVGKYWGAAIGPPLFGFIADTGTYRHAFWYSAVALGLSALLVVYARNRRAA